MAEESMDSITESGEVTFTVKTKSSWVAKLNAIKKRGISMENRFRKKGHKMMVKVLAPREMQAADKVPLGAVVIDLDWKTATRLEMVVT